MRGSVNARVQRREIEDKSDDCDSSRRVIDVNEHQDALASVWQEAEERSEELGKAHEYLDRSHRHDEHQTISARNQV